MADGVIIEHPTARSRCCLIELRDRPYYLSCGAAGVCDGKNGRPLIPAPILDCGCGVPHEFVTLHVWVDGDGRATVAVPVWHTMLGAGETGFRAVSHTPTPPPIEITRPRPAVDYDNRAYRPLTPIRPFTPPGDVLASTQSLLG